jgi:hypothetical protein
MSETLLIEIATSVISSRDAVDNKTIRDAVEQAAMLPMFAEMNLDLDRLEELLISKYQVSMTEGATLIDQDHKPWLAQSKAGIDWYYWRRYRKYLGQTGLSPNVVNTVDSTTDRVLGLIENPLRSDPWDRRGLVLGHVQSGKTSNYIGLVNKAADAGYKLIVVIAGVHNRLRNQTQTRVDEGFIGRDSALVIRKARSKFVGVGKLGEERFPVPFTNSVSDFNKSTASSVGISLSNLNEPAVFVIKKNSTTLKNLIEWLHAYSSLGPNQQIDEPFLLIDDEADNASINTSRDPYAASRINGQIRELLSIFTRSSYVGYTATPFANIFIDPATDVEMLGEDLFPRDFIVSLDPASNYFGPDVVFDGSDPSPVLRYIEDNEIVLPARQSRDFSVSELPGSLHEAVRTFLMGRAIRILRGDGSSHCSMLVNASPYTRIHGELRNQLQEYLTDVQNQTSLYAGLAPEQAIKYPAIGALYRTWDKEFSHLEFNWRDVQQVLKEAAAPVSVVEINSRSSGSLPYQDYKDSGLSVIAVGGYSLSRGLTLEGLMVSYFLRSSRMYDTLMQMGRWFGYRTGYQDLCRVWMPEEAAGWYEHISDAIEQLRHEVRTMESYGARPVDFGLKVRAHPDMLIVTARNKMGTSEKIPVSLSLARTFAETAQVKWDPVSRLKNLDAVKKLVDSIKAAGFIIPNADGSGNRVLTNIPVDLILPFLRRWDNVPFYYKTDPELVSKYIEHQRSRLSKWDVAFIGLSDTSRGITDASLGFPLVRQNRSAGRGYPRKGVLRITNKQRIASPHDERLGINDELATQAEIQYRNKQEKSSGTIPGHVYREVRTRPLLLVHLLTILDVETGKPLDTDVTPAWSISFPATGNEDDRVDYVVNSTWLQEFYSDLNVDEDDEISDLAD